jgi:hypothetical protein
MASAARTLARIVGIDQDEFMTKTAFSNQLRRAINA